MADPKVKTSKTGKPEEGAALAPGGQDPAAAPVAAPAAPAAVAPAPAPAAAPAVVESPPGAPTPLDGVSGSDLLFKVSTDLVEPLAAAVMPLEQWSYYGQRCPAAVDVLKERCRQVEDEGFGIERDDACTDYQLPRAAVCYAIRGAGLPPHRATLYWPFAPVDFKPVDRRGNLVKAAALILAEIERLDRAERLQG